MQTNLLWSVRMIQKTGIQRAVDMFDGVPAKLADAVGNGVVRQHVEHWLKAGRVSAEKCPEVAIATGLSCEELNDRVNWALAREVVVAPAIRPVQSMALDKETDRLMAEGIKAGVIKDRRDPTSPGRRATDVKAYAALDAVGGAEQAA